MIRFVNLTPHEISFDLDDGSRQTVQPHPAPPVRIQMLPQVTRKAEGITFASRPVPNQDAIDDAIAGIQSAMRESGAHYAIVPLFAMALIVEWRPNMTAVLDRLVAPDSGPNSAIRDERGNIVAVRRLVVAGRLHD